MVDDHDTTVNLKSMLARLGIKSANTITIGGTMLDMNLLEEVSRQAINSFGQPDQIYMSPTMLSEFSKIFGGRK